MGRSTKKGSNMQTVSDLTSVYIGILSAIAAVVSALFAWKAVKSAERANSSSLFTELHKIYSAPETFSAIQTVWELYSKYQPTTNRAPLTHKQALQFVSETDKKSPEWKAVHDVTVFWEYVSVLVDRGLVDEGIAFEAFTSPQILGFLYPIEESFVKYYHRNYGRELPLQRLYLRWSRYISKHQSARQVTLEKAKQ
jgi:hypothetical protein